MLMKLSDFLVVKSKADRLANRVAPLRHKSG